MFRVSETLSDAEVAVGLRRLVREGMAAQTMGTLTGSPAHPREVFREALAHGSASLILCHNHPSGDPTPSEDDVTLTARLQEAGEVMGVPVLDHIIIGGGRYVSLKEAGKM